MVSERVAKTRQCIREIWLDGEDFESEYASVE
jgi:hypothetical protein